MAVVSFNEIVEFNKLLEKRGCKYKLHLRDTCGCQSFWIESLQSKADDVDKVEFNKLLEDFFAKKKLTIIYNNSKKMDFVVK